MNTKLIYAFGLLLAFNLGFGQISGNSIYNQKRDNYENPSEPGFTLTDGYLTVKVKILMNKKADRVMMTLGLNEEAATVENCNTQINKRISDFIEKLYKVGIKKEDVYVDFISQIKIYDFNFANNQAEQFEKGFEIKKNIIITLNSLKNIDSIIEMASQSKIYDIIKVDYIADDSNAVYDTLFEEATKIGLSKKDKYLKAFGKRTIGTPIASDQFSIITPETQYKNYKAFESSELESYYDSNNSLLKKTARKNNTFYYDGISQSNMDKVINSASAEVGIQYTLSMTITYKIDTSY